MSSGEPRTHAAVDAAAATLAPAILILAPLNDVVVRNVRDLQYHPALMGAFFAAGVLLWAAGFLALRRWTGGWRARAWLTAPWAVLLLDVAGGAVERTGAPLPAAAAADVLVVAAVAAVAWASRPAMLRRVAAAAGVVLTLHGAVSHALFVNEVAPDLVVGAGREPRSGRAAADPQAPGNVYHILLDAYLSESFESSTGASAAARYPGFTYYTRFNTNFPRTSSAEPALIHGRLPAPGLPVEQWSDLALDEGFWRELAGAGIGTWIYPYARWLCPDDAVKCVASADLARDAGATTTRDATIDLWASRLMPVSLRRRLVAGASGTAEATGAVPVSSLARGLFGIGEGAAAGRVSALPLQYFNLQQFDELLADEARRPARGQYVYYHALIPHHDLIMNERCELVADPPWNAEAYWGHVACANLMIDRLVQTLSRLGRLDEALIVVHADHGDPEFLAGPAGFGRAADFALDEQARVYQPVDTTYHASGEYERQINAGDSAAWRSMAVEVMSSGLLLVKFPGAQTYRRDPSPAQLLDIAPTVLRHFGVGAASFDGVPLTELRPDREAVFYAHSRNFDGKLSKYRLTPRGWTFVEDVPVVSSSDD